MPELQAVLRIKVQDDTAPALAAVKKHIENIEKSLAGMDRFVAAVSRVTKSTDPLAASLLGVQKGLSGQRAELSAAVGELDRLIAPTDRAAAAQRNLSRQVEVATGALARQGEAMARAGRIAQSVGGGGARGGAVHTLPVGKGAGKHGGHGLGLLPGVGPFLPVVAAVETFEIGKKVVESAADLEQQRFRIRELSRNDPSEAPLADSLAAEVAAKYPGITQAKALDTYSELRANAVDARGRVDPAVARRNLMAAARAQNAALALGIEMTPVDMQNLLKGVEGSGRANDPKAVEKISDAYIRAKQVFGSAIASSMIRDYVANAKSANFSIGDDQFYLANMVRMSEGNASRFGNETNQTLATMVGGHMTKATGAWMVAHGLARPDQIVKTGPGTVAIKGGLKDAATLETDQRVWAGTTLRKAIEDSGALSDDKVAARAKMLRDQELKRNPNAEIDERFTRERAEEGLIAAELAKTGMRTSVTDNLAHYIGNQRLIERDIAALLNASGNDAGDRIAQNPVAAFAELTGALSNFGTVLSSPAIKAAGPVMDALARGISSLTTSLAGFMEHGLDFNKYPGVKAPDDWPTTGDWRTRVAYAHQADMHPLIRGERDMEGARAGALSHLFEGGHVAQEIDVHGEATVRVPVAVTVTASSELLRIVQDARDAAREVIAKVPLNPVATGHSGRMDSDAAPGVGNGIWDR